MRTCTKRFSEIPFAHRQWRHDGHCALIHGHGWSFEFTFTGPLDAQGFIIDFGKFGWLKAILDKLDHACVLNSDDPQLEFLTTKCASLFRFVIVPSCSAEGIAEWIASQVENTMPSHEKARLVRVTVFEDSRNSATFYLEE